MSNTKRLLDEQAARKYRSKTKGKSPKGKVEEPQPNSKDGGGSTPDVPKLLSRFLIKADLKVEALKLKSHKDAAIKYIQEHLSKDSSSQDETKLRIDIAEFASGRKPLRALEQKSSLYTVNGGKSELTEEGKRWCFEHLFKIPSMIRKDYFDTVTQIDNKCIHWKIGGENPLTPALLQFVSEQPGWFGVSQGILKPLLHSIMLDLKVFNQGAVLRDTVDTIYLQYKDALCMITKDKVEYSNGTPYLIWTRNIIPRNAPSTKGGNGWMGKYPLFDKIVKEMVVAHHQQRFIEALGYLIHRYNFASAQQLVWAHDWQPKSRQDGQRGKDFTLFELVDAVRNSLSVKYNPDNSFNFGKVTYETENIHIRDVPASFSNDMKDSVDGDLEANEKYQVSQVFNRRDRAKISTSSQYSPESLHDRSIFNRFPTIGFTDHLQTNPFGEEYFRYQNEKVDENSPGWWRESAIWKDCPEGTDEFLIFCAQSWLRNPTRICKELLKEDRLMYYEQMFGSQIKAIKALKEAGELPTYEVADLLGVSEKNWRALQSMKYNLEIYYPGYTVTHSSRAGGFDGDSRIAYMKCERKENINYESTIIKLGKDKKHKRKC